MNNTEQSLVAQKPVGISGSMLSDMEGPSLTDHNPYQQSMAKPVGVTGSMSSAMEGPSLNDANAQEAFDIEVGLAIGIIDNMIAFRITHPSGEEILMRFTVDQMYTIMSAQQSAIDLLNQTKN